MTGADIQKDEYFAYDVITLFQRALDSVANMIVENYNPNARLYFSLNGEDIVIEDQIYLIIHKYIDNL